MYDSYLELYFGEKREVGIFFEQPHFLAKTIKFEMITDCMSFAAVHIKWCVI